MIRPVRLALLGFAHESNTFVIRPTTYADIEAAGILRGDQIVAAHASAQSTVAGFLEVGAADVEVVPLLFTSPGPSGTVTGDAFERVTDEMVSLLFARGPWNGVLLAQHGAAVAEGDRDADAEVVRRVRAVVGNDVPIGLALDMHANLSLEMIESATVTVIYRTNPHVDARPRARECAELIVRTIRGEVRPVQALEALPAAIDILRQSTNEPPMADVIGDLDAVLSRPGVLSASVAEGYPYADVPKMGMAVLVVQDGDEEAAAEHARWLAVRTWQRRHAFIGSAPGASEALRAAAGGPKPVVLLDVGDNIGGGSPGDSTVLLATARELGIGSVLAILRDPEAVAACVAAGADRRVEVRVGAKTDQLHGEPMPVSGTVRRIGEGRFEDPSPTHGGRRFFDAGRSVVLETDDGQTLVLHEKRLGPYSLEQLRVLGLDPRTFQVVIAKGVHSPRPAYEPIASRLIWVNTPGVTGADLTRLPYRHRRRPMFPWEPEAPYE